MIYSMSELKDRLEPIAAKYQLPAVYIFGSYARNEATDKSDIDIMIDRTGSKAKGMLFGGLYNDLQECLGKSIDLITTESLEQESTKNRVPKFIDSIRKDAVRII